MKKRAIAIGIVAICLLILNVSVCSAEPKVACGKIVNTDAVDCKCDAQYEMDEKLWIQCIYGARYYFDLLGSDDHLAICEAEEVLSQCKGKHSDSYRYRGWYYGCTEAKKYYDGL